MTIPRTRSRAPLPAEAGNAVHVGPEGLRGAFAKLLGQAQSSDHVFGSPLGPFTLGQRSHWLPRFAYFGPQFSDASVRLAIYAGIDGSDARSTLALVRFIERLILKPDLGHGLNLTFFPLVNPSGLETSSRFNARGVDLSRQHWNLSSEPEIELLAGDARTRGYHGFVRIEAAPIVQLAAVLRSGSRMAQGTDLVLVPPAVDGEPFPTRWVVDANEAVTNGPLTLADDLIHGPFELALLVPNVWSEEVFTEAVVQVLRRFLVHFRSSYAYGIHL
ncbi:MAG: hypothetical protein IAE82_14825 [Opitutaceae bacterium]|nr:hypothetical protein [Opitutaceae bacterium]